MIRRVLNAIVAMVLSLLTIGSLVGMAIFFLEQTKGPVFISMESPIPDANFSPRRIAKISDDSIFSAPSYIEILTKEEFFILPAREILIWPKTSILGNNKITFWAYCPDISHPYRYDMYIWDPIPWRVVNISKIESINTDKITLELSTMWAAVILTILLAGLIIYFIKSTAMHFWKKVRN